MDDCPSKDVYHQLQSLSKHNPCFVQSLQSIMTQNIMAEESPDPSGPADPLSSNQAVLALLLAAHLKPSQGLQQGAASLSQLIKQLEAGTSAVELLKSALATGGSGQRSGLLPSPGPAPPNQQSPGPLGPPAPPDLSALISSMTSLVSQGKLPAKAPASLGPATKNPQLMNMLYSAFQVRLVVTIVRTEESQGLSFRPELANTTRRWRVKDSQAGRVSRLPPWLLQQPPHTVTLCPAPSARSTLQASTLPPLPPAPARPRAQARLSPSTSIRSWRCLRPLLPLPLPTRSKAGRWSVSLARVSSSHQC